MRLLFTVLLASLFGTPFAAADHAQTFGSKTATFDHRGGNEWWVEVRMTGSSLSKVEAQDTGDASWHALTLRSWGNWAGSFHIEPGNRVRFRATFADGATGTSCWFTHPAGAEQCGTTGGFDATFTGVKGNAWWQEVRVSVTGGTLSGVDVRMNEGAWKPLSLRSWGAWAASYHAPEGTTVQFRARSTTGAEDLSGCYRWVSAAPTSCGNVWPREGSFVKYFTSGGTSVPGYSDTTQANVTFRYSNARWEVLCEGFTRTVVEDSSDETERFSFKAAFDPPRAWDHDGLVRGYELDGCRRDMVHDFGPADVTTGTRTYTKNGVPVTVDAGIASYDDGCCSERGTVWHPETELILEANFAGLHSGSRTRLMDTDAPIAATDAAPLAPAAPAWPRAGSSVRYDATLVYDTSSTTATMTETSTWTYDGTRWTNVCGQVTTYADGSPGSAWETTTEDAVLPRGPVNGVAIGDSVFVPAGGCTGMEDVTRLKYNANEPTVRDGVAVTTAAWHSDEDPDEVGDDDAWWHKGTGIVLRWEYDGPEDDPSAWSYRGRLTNTDAPL